MKTVRSTKPGRPKDESLWASRTDEILDTAATIFAQQGYQDTEMQLIADALEIGKGTIYRYFPSKQELFLKAVWRGMDRLRQAVRSAYEPIEDALDRLTVAIRAYLTFFRNHPQYVELLIQERAKFRDRKKQTYFEHREKNVGEWRQMYADLISRGTTSRRAGRAGFLMPVSDLVYGTMFTNHFTGRHKPLEAQAKDLVDILFYGIFSDRERAARQRTRRRCAGRRFGAERRLDRPCQPTARQTIAMKPILGLGLSLLIDRRYRRLRAATVADSGARRKSRRPLKSITRFLSRSKSPITRILPATLRRRRPSRFARAFRVIW